MNGSPTARKPVLLVAVDASVSSDCAFNFAADHALRLGAQLHLVHVIARDTPA